jgi:hypothetical protein
MKVNTLLSMFLVGGMLGGCVAEASDVLEEEVAAEDVAAKQDPLAIYQFPQWYSNTCQVNGLTFLCCPGNTFMIGARLDQGRLKCAAGFDSGTMGAPFVDGQDGIGNTLATQRRGMHACPWGSIMVGMNVERNDLLCRNYAGINQYTSEKVDGGTQDNVGHVCEPANGTPPLGAIHYHGRAMTGIHVINNWFLCAL